MASEPAASPAQSDASSPRDPDQPVVDLVIVSPSVGVPQPLRFPGTPAATTIKQLKAKIRDAVTLRPADENQRLIHRGRALIRDGDTLLEVLGADSIAADQQQTMHLVVRDIAHPAQTPVQPQSTLTNSSGSRDSSPAPANGSQARGAHAQSPHDLHMNMIQRRMLANANAINQAMNQAQRGRAQMGMRGIGDTNLPQTAQIDGRDRRVSPAPSSHTIMHEQGPNGRTYRVETTVRTTSSSSNGISPADIQNIFQSADANQATLTMTNAMNNAMQRSGSSASMHNRPFNQPGVTVPIHPGTGSRAGSGRTTPFGGVPGAPGLSPRAGQEVYILSSPEGPRALLVNNTTAETYWTPRLSTRRSLPRMHNAGFNPMMPDFQSYQRTQPMTSPFQPFPNYQNPMQYPQPPTMDNLRLAMPQNQRSDQAQHQNATASPQPELQGQAQGLAAQPQQAVHAVQAQAQDQPAIQAPVGDGLGHPHVHPPVAAIPPLLRIVWPHVWLIFRLALFVWIFTSPGASWSRWMTIIGLAIFIFVLSTGALNGIAEHIMGPVGRHLDNLLPALDGQQRRAANAPRPAAHAQGPAVGGPGREHRPEQMAERLINERRARDGWFTGQFRRVERASLLFLASIAPGVAERHIAHLEAEAARERREAEEAEAARAAAEAERQNNEDASNDMGAAGDEDETRPTDAERDGSTDPGTGTAAAQAHDREREAAPEPLIAL